MGETDNGASALNDRFPDIQESLFRRIFYRIEGEFPTPEINTSSEKHDSRRPPGSLAALNES